MGDAAVVGAFFASFYLREWRLKKVSAKHKEPTGFAKGEVSRCSCTSEGGAIAFNYLNSKEMSNCFESVSHRISTVVIITD